MSYKNPSPKRSSRLSTPVRLGVAAVAACFIAGPALSNPVNPTVVNGTATFSQAGNVLTVTNSNGAIIDWQKFSINAGETTHFAQTAASSSVMNRVLNDPSAIYGTLSSNGRVFLVNPAGIMVGPGGRIDTAGFVASTLAVRNEDFLAGRHLFVNDGNAQNVINRGEIRTPAGGSVYLIGSNVSNEGIITTPGGETILAAGATVSLIDSAMPGVKVDITGAAGDATNLGEITAEAGRIGIAGVIVRNSGTLNASSVVNDGGRIFLKASQDAYVDGNGRIVTTGTKGGSVEVLGNSVTVTDDSVIDASGASGGGKILVGGDYQGKNPEIQNASTSYFGPAASLKADATEVGAGGTVIVWADDTTRAYGNISARGGALGGDGGLVETSGHQYLDIAGARVDTRAPTGKTGNWLLDPVDVSILQYGGMPTSGSAPFAPTGNSVIWAEDLSAALGTTDVTIQTEGGSGGAGNITMTGASINGISRLILAAYGGAGATGDITITDSNINLGSGFRALAGWNGATTYYGSDVIAGTGNIAINGSMIHASSYVDLHAGNDISLGSSGAYGSWVQSFGNMLVTAGNDLNLFGGSGDISGPQGPGVVLRGDTSQTIKVDNQILLQAGSANNTNYSGSTMYGASVAIQSGGDQDISAGAIKVYAGSSGHDNSAEIQATGNQSLTIYGGVLDIRGGGDASTSVYGGQGSYNNAARIQHGQSYGGEVYTGSGDQTLTLYGGASVILQAGSGTGVLGYYGSDCYASGAGDLCRGSSNDAHLQNGIGAQTLDFDYGGAISITGGSAGRQNWAGISNQSSATTQMIFGNPDITLTGGSGGGTGVSYGGDVFQLSNDADISSNGSGTQTVYAGTITINGGNAQYGGAGFGSDSGNGLFITTTGDLSMYGGSSNAGDPFAAAVYIGNKAGGAINLDVGGDLYVKAGSGTAAPVLIGSIDGPATVSIVTGGNVSVVADGSHVGIGSDSASYGASVYIAAGGNLTVTDNATRGVRIGSLSDSAGATDVTLLAGGDIAIGSATGYGALIGVKTPSGVSNVTIRAGEYGGGDLVLAASSRIKAAGGQVMLGARQSAATNGNITQDSGGIIYGGDVSFNAEGSASFSGSMTAGTGMISGLAGLADGGEGGSGGNIFVAGTLLGNSGIELRAREAPDGSMGQVSQTGSSSISAPNGGIHISGGGDVTLDGSVTAYSSIDIGAGFYAGLGYGDASRLGGNLVVGGILGSDFGGINLVANVGYETYAKGTITQGSGSSIVGSGVNIAGGGSVSLGGTVAATAGELIVQAGYQTASLGGIGIAGFGYGYGSPTPYGGNLTIGGTLSGYGDVKLAAESGYNSGLNGSITQSAGSNISSDYGGIEIMGGGNVTLNGSMVLASSNTIGITAGASAYGNGEATDYGGNVALGGNIDAGSGSVNIVANVGYMSGSNGNITQSAGSSILGGNADITGGGSVDLAGVVSASSGQLTARAGHQLGEISGPSPNGGNLTISGTLAAQYGVWLTAESGDSSGANGNILQSAGSVSSAYGSIHIEGGGNVTLNGSTSAYGGSGSIRSGLANVMGPSYGGNITLGGDHYAANGLSLYAFSGGTGTVGNGHIVQNGGSLASNNTIGLYADGNIGLQGRVETPDYLYIYAGLNNGSNLGMPGYQGAYGGDVGFGAGSAIYGGHVEIVANRGTTGGSLGNIRQEAGGLLHVTGVTSLYAYAAGNVDLLGATLVDAGAPVVINAGYDYTGYGGQAFADKHVSIAGLDAEGSGVDIYATGAIRANTQGAASIYANISNSSSGGIEIANTGNAEPAFIDLNDGATANSAVTFTHSGSDLTLDSSRSFSTYGGAGAINVSALSGNLNYLGGGTLSGSSVILSANNQLNIDGPLSASGALGLAAGVALNVSNFVGAHSVSLSGPTINLVNGSVCAVNDAIAIGSVINIGAGYGRLVGANVLLRGATEGTGTLNLNGGVQATSGNLEFNLGSINAYGGGLFAPVDIVGLVTGDILLGGGAYIHAGNDVRLTQNGATSLLSMSSGGHVLAGMPTTIHLDFPNRDSSGVVTDGSPGSGLFVVVNGAVTPATPGNGLELTLRPVQTAVDPCVANPDLCKPPAPKDTPIQTTPPAPSLAKTDPTQPLLDPNATTGGTEGNFGDTGTTGTTGDQPPTDEGTGTSAAKDEGSKDEKKDEKDEKDKKSDEAKEEKKDEKPAQKKVAQCT
ncbi:MAG: filamentous hemagglutinin N-terminal domain-containing protein [Sulfuritalea sp.]|nr:filamentous hemagglutinin N-terminal domain-containing protein [Sulfuritalea sp.]